jgi:cysteine desulfurase
VVRKNLLIYLDHAATTPLRPEVLRAMKPYLTKWYGNASALYSQGVEAHTAIESARKTIANFIHTNDDSIIFTSGGTESCNMAVLGTARKHRLQGNHIITTAVEHHAVLNACKQLERESFEVTYLPVDQYGFVTVEQVKKALRPTTILVSIMYVNNEIGTIEPIADIGKLLLRVRKESGGVYPYFHTDACQAAQYLELDVEKLHVDLVTLNSGKMYGPKGVGCLYVRRGVSFEPLMYGGSQENHLRPGTENVAGIVGFATAFALARKEAKKESVRQRKLCEVFFKSLTKSVPGVILNGPEISEFRVPNNLNITIPGIEAETLLLYLDRYGIMASTGSACTVRAVDTSHVLRAIGRTGAEAKGSVRFTVGRNILFPDIARVVKNFQNILAKFF